MIPLIDVHRCILDLNSWGWRDYKIEVACGLSPGCAFKVKAGKIQASEMGVGRAHRLYNFWETEAVARGITIPPYSPLAQKRAESVTT